MQQIPGLYIIVKGKNQTESGLYIIVRGKNQTVAPVFSRIPLKLSFKRALVGEKLKMKIKLVSRVIHVVLEET